MMSDLYKYILEFLRLHVYKKEVGDLLDFTVRSASMVQHTEHYRFQNITCQAGQAAPKFY